MKENKNVTACGMKKEVLQLRRYEETNSRLQNRSKYPDGFTEQQLNRVISPYFDLGVRINAIGSPKMMLVLEKEARRDMGKSYRYRITDRAAILIF